MPPLQRQDRECTSACAYCNHAVLLLLCTSCDLAECHCPRGLIRRHVAKLWNTNGTILSQALIPPSVFNGTAKWVQWPIGPVVIGPGPQYMITVSDGTEKGHHWAGCPSCWLPAGSNGRHVFWPAGSARFGLFSNGSDMPGALQLPAFPQAFPH